VRAAIIMLRSSWRIGCVRMAAIFRKKRPIGWPCRTDAVVPAVRKINSKASQAKLIDCKPTSDRRCSSSRVNSARPSDSARTQSIYSWPWRTRAASAVTTRERADLGLLDERGYLFLRDRSRDVIITGGFNVYPSDVETVIARHPAVAECVVFGVPDDHWGEAVHAVIEPRPELTPDIGAIIAFLKHELGSVKTPKAVHVYPAIPKSPVGKVLKSAVRDQVLAGLHVDEHRWE
jgi:acyl-coenzyme A synthetase/AMP-(fatty) acid ligase